MGGVLLRSWGMALRHTELDPGLNAWLKGGESLCPPCPISTHPRQK